MTGEPEAGGRLDLARGALQHATGHLRQPATPFAPDMIVVRPPRFKAGEAVADIQTLHHSLGLEDSDRPENRGVVATPG